MNDTTENANVNEISEQDLHRAVLATFKRALESIEGLAYAATSGGFECQAVASIRPEGKLERHVIVDDSDRKESLNQAMQFLLAGCKILVAEKFCDEPKLKSLMSQLYDLVDDENE